ncbi:unnamed protein product [Owenia fusiformis]|uniref:Uncharacterized protein n=1 Tax=Owenia fusiformis TaxID=6347 RepID=A0A8J1UKX4_OWEFU|nr:unnamed protein product [Owenia fusiformis]
MCLLACACVSLTYGESSSNIEESNQYEVFARNLLMRLLTEDTRGSADGSANWAEGKREDLVESDLLLQEETRFASELESLERAIENTKKQWTNAGDDCKLPDGTMCVNYNEARRCCKCSKPTCMPKCKEDTGCCIYRSYRTVYNSCEPVRK